MELEDVVIVGAGIAGVTTALGLYRLGIKSLVLESSANLRVTGFAFVTWTNAWKAIDALGIGHYLRAKHELIDGLDATSTVTGQIGAKVSFKAQGKQGQHEVRCVKRKLLLEALANELPQGTIKFLSKVISIEESGYFKLVRLEDGTIVKTKVVIGCDGVNSKVGKWLGFKKAAFTGRSAIRGYANFTSGHGYSPKFMQFFGKGYRSGFIPCDSTTIYWFFTWTPTALDEMVEDNPAKMKEFVLSRTENAANDKMKIIVETTELDNIDSAPLRYRHPWDLLWGNISKGNVCVGGDALHPMTPDIGQGGCAALEDGIVLARCLAQAFFKCETKEKLEKQDYKRIEMGLKKYAQERKWRCFDLITTAYLVGFIQQSNDKLLNLLRDKVLVKFLSGLLLKRSDFDCGKLSVS